MNLEGGDGSGSGSAGNGQISSGENIERDRGLPQPKSSTSYVDSEHVDDATMNMSISMSLQGSRDNLPLPVVSNTINPNNINSYSGPRDNNGNGNHHYPHQQQIPPQEHQQYNDNNNNNNNNNNSQVNQLHPNQISNQNQSYIPAPMPTTHVNYLRYPPNTIHNNNIDNVNGYLDMNMNINNNLLPNPLNPNPNLQQHSYDRPGSNYLGESMLSNDPLNSGGGSMNQAGTMSLMETETSMNGTSIDGDGIPKVSSMSLMNEKEVLKLAGKVTIQKFLKSCKCYDVMRTSGKVIVFDINIPFQLAFYAMVEHEVAAAPLWEASKQRRYVGLMVITDFIDTIRDYYSKGVSMQEVAMKTIGDVLRDPQGHRMYHSTFISGTAADTVYDACRSIVKKKLRYLPLIDPLENIMLGVLSQHDIVEYLVSTFREQRKLFEQSIYELNIGVHSNVITMPHSSRLFEVLELMETRNISAVPIVDDDGKVVDLYHRSDVTFIALAADGETTLSNLNLMVAEVLLQGRRQGRSSSTQSMTRSTHSSSQSNTNSAHATPGSQTPNRGLGSSHSNNSSSSTGSGSGSASYLGEGSVSSGMGYADYPVSDKLHTCSNYDSLQIIFEKFAEVKFQTLVCVNDEQHCTGIVALGDLVAYFVD